MKQTVAVGVIKVTNRKETPTKGVAKKWSSVNYQPIPHYQTFPLSFNSTDSLIIFIVMDM